jgi:pyruvate/2-oxoglutarate dehydrogenase complex dihydrolipoamide acyltransferase (E2) component
MATNVVMPQLGESVVEGTVGKWFKQVGDKVEQYEPVMEVITDKVTTEIPSSSAGTLLQILVPEGTTVKAGTVLAVIGQPGEKVEGPSSTAPHEEPPVPPVQVKQEPAPDVPETTAVIAETQRIPPLPVELTMPSGQTAPEKKDGGAAMRLTPVVARMISEFNITGNELKEIQGTGEGGRVSKKDIESFLKTRGARKAMPQPELAPWEQPGTGELFRPTEESFAKEETVKRPPAPAIAPAAPVQPPSKPGGLAGEGEEVIPLTQMRRSIAEHMLRSMQTAPHVTTIHEVDMTRVIEHMKAHQEEFTNQGARLTYTPYFVQAAIAALSALPIVNAQYTDRGIIMKRALNIGIAVAIEDGLIVPIIRNAGDKSLMGLARAVNDLAVRAREKRLSPDDVQGGTFTITNYGIFGSLFGTPIISQPQSAILGVGAIQKRVVVIDEAIAIRPMVYLGLTFDHRLLDGAVGDQFMNKLKQFLTEYH